MAILSDKLFLVLRKEATWATYDAGGSDLPTPFYNGNYGVNLRDPVRIQPHVDGSMVTRWGVQDVRDLEGPLEMGIYPDTVGKFLDWIWKRDSTSGDGESYSADLVKPGIEAYRDLGLKVGSAAINFADGGDIVFNLTLRGRYRSKILPSGSPAALPAYSGYTFPAIHSFVFANLRFLVSLDAGASPALAEIVPVGVESGTINLNNNLVPGQHVEDLILAEKDGALEYLLSGGQDVDGSFVVLLDRDDFLDLKLAKDRISFRAMGTHRSASYTTVGVAGALAGSNVTVPVADSSDFTAGDVVMFHTADVTKRSVAVVTSVPTGTSIVVAVLDKAVVSGDYVFNKAVEFHVPQAMVQEITEDKRPGGVVKVTFNWTTIAESNSTTLFSYKGEGAA